MAAVLTKDPPRCSPIPNGSQRRIDRYAKLDYVQVKISSSIKPELVPDGPDGAGSWHRMSGRVVAFMTAQQFVEDRADEIQHMNFIFLNFMFDAVKDTRVVCDSPKSPRTRRDRSASQRFQGCIRFLQQHKTVLDPTLTIFEGMCTDRPGTVSTSYAAVADRMPAQIRRQFFYGGLDVLDGMDQRYRDSFQQMLKMARALYDAGIPVVAGTDGMAGFTLHRELELYVQRRNPRSESSATGYSRRRPHHENEIRSWDRSLLEN